MVSHDAGAERYALSFTSGALLAREATVVAPLYLRERDWSRVREMIRDGNLLQSRTVSSGFRLAREVAQRLATLSDDELEMLIDATATERGHLMWVAACRRYSLIGDFAEEIVRERFLLLTPTLDYDDFDSFVHGKSLWHSELAELKDSTIQKLRSTVFRMLTEAGLLSERGDILHAVLSDRVVDLLDARTPSDVRFLPVTIAGKGTR